MTEERSRAEEIWELEGMGKNQKQIAEALGVSTRTIRRERKTPEYIEMWESMELLYDKGLREMYASERGQDRQEALKEMGRRSRSSQNIRIKTYEMQLDEKILTPEQEAERITERRKRTDHIWKEVLRVQGWQYERLHLYYQEKPYDHIDKHWKPEQIAQKVSNHY